MDETTLRTDSAKYNNGTMQKQLIHEEWNTMRNFQCIVDSFEKGRGRDISAEKKVDKIPAFVLGSGPSLDDSIEHLKDWKGGIFCSTSQALSLMRFGIEPTHIVALDPFCTWEEIAGVDWSKTKTKLIAHPGVWPSLLQNWPNEILYYIQNIGRPDSFYSNTQKRMLTWKEETDKGIRDPIFHYYIITEITIFACSPPMQMFMADLLGYGTIFLAGVDFAYHTDKTRFSNYTPHTIGEVTTWEKHIHPYTPHDKIITTSNGLPSEEIHLYYKKNMLSAWRLANQTVYTTDKGAITEIPYASVQKVVRQQGIGFQKQGKPFIANHTEKYLASVGAFVVETSAGVSFVEAMKPAHDLPRFMFELLAMYKCDACGATMRAENIMENHTNKECAMCKKGKLQHVHAIDVEYNIKKFVKLLKENNIEVDEVQWGIKPPADKKVEVLR